jgi:hypothetical protein
MVLPALALLGGCSLLFDGKDLHGGGDLGTFSGGGDLPHKLTLGFTPTAASPYMVGSAPYSLVIGDSTATATSTSPRPTTTTAPSPSSSATGTAAFPPSSTS